MLKPEFAQKEKENFKHQMDGRASLVFRDYGNLVDTKVKTLQMIHGWIHKFLALGL